jgi:F-type H+-transporting ATPase subunit b
VAEPPAHHGGGEHHEAEEDENGPPGPVNWWHGLLGTKEGVEPNLLWRAPGEPAPFLAVVLNFAVLIFVFVKYGRKPMAEALTRRKTKIMQEIDQAQKFKEDAEARLRGYQAKIDGISEEIERIRRDFRAQGEHERERIVREANERRDRMRRDAELLLAQELKQMQGDLMRETVDAALVAANELVAARITRDDHDRMAETFLTQLSGTRDGGQSSSYPAVASGTGGLS